MGKKKRSAFKNPKGFAASARDYYYDAPERTLSEALEHCKKWQSIMMGVNESARIMQTIAQQALTSTTQAKAFVNLMSMTKKDSDLYTAVNQLITTIQAFAQMAKSEVMAKEIIDYIFSTKKTMGGSKVKSLDEILNQLADKKESLTVEFKVGTEGENVTIQVKKKSRSTPYSPKRAEMLNQVITIMQGAVEQAGQKYSMVVQSVVQLTEFLDMVNNFAKTKTGSEERESMKNKMESHPLWSQFEGFIKFPEMKEKYEYTMDVKSPDKQVVSALLEFSRSILVQAVEAGASPVAEVDIWHVSLGDATIQSMDIMLEAAKVEETAPTEEKKPFLTKVMDKGKEFMQGLVPEAEPMPIAAALKKVRAKADGNDEDLEEEIEKGGKIESEEHDLSDKAGEKIAKDHLEESEDYYEELEEMEEELEEKEEENNNGSEVSEEQEKKIRKWILDQKSIDDTEFHTFLDGMGLGKDAGEEVVYKFIRDLSGEVADPIKIGIKASKKVKAVNEDNYEEYLNELGASVIDNYSTSQVLKEWDEIMYREELNNWFDGEQRNGSIPEDADDADDYAGDFDTFLDENYKPSDILGQDAPGGSILKEVDPIAFRVGMSDYESDMGYDEEEEDLEDLMFDIEESVNEYNDTVGDESYIELLDGGEVFEYLEQAKDDLEKDVSSYLKLYGADGIIGEFPSGGEPIEFTEFFNTYVAPKLAAIGHNIQACDKKKAEACGEENKPKEMEQPVKRKKDYIGKGPAMKKSFKKSK